MEQLSFGLFTIVQELQCHSLLLAAIPQLRCCYYDLLWAVLEALHFRTYPAKRDSIHLLLGAIFSWKRVLISILSSESLYWMLESH